MYVAYCRMGSLKQCMSSLHEQKVSLLCTVLHGLQDRVSLAFKISCTHEVEPEASLSSFLNSLYGLGWHVTICSCSKYEIFHMFFLRKNLVVYCIWPAINGLPHTITMAPLQKLCMWTTLQIALLIFWGYICHMVCGKWFPCNRDNTSCKATPSV